MLSTLDGKRISSVPHQRDFRSVIELLGPDRTREVREYLVQLVDELEPPPGRDTRWFSSSHLGSRLTPWAYPLQHLYDISWEIEGDAASDDVVEDRAALIFGLFVWESIMLRGDDWVFYDPNLSATDPNREITGKVYFEPR